MKQKPIVLALILGLTFTGCAKEVAEELGIIPTIPCGTDGARMQATINGADWCADATLIAMGTSDELLLNGISLGGSTISLQLDSMTVGDHPLDEFHNSVLLMHLGTTLVSKDSDPGIITVIDHDTAARRLKAVFTVRVYSDLTGSSRELNGNLDVTYSQQ